MVRAGNDCVPRAMTMATLDIIITEFLLHFCKVFSVWSFLIVESISVEFAWFTSSLAAAAAAAPSRIQ